MALPQETAQASQRDGRVLQACFQTGLTCCSTAAPFPRSREGHGLAGGARARMHGTQTRVRCCLRPVSLASPPPGPSCPLSVATWFPLQVTHLALVR